MKKFSLIAMLLIAVMLIIGCSHNAEVSKNADDSLNVSFSASNTENHNSKIVTEHESSTEISTTETTTAYTTTKPKETEKSTTAKTTVPKQATQTTTQRQTTTKKVTTTQKPTTTKTTTTAAPYWCDEGGTHHSCDVGQIGWCNSYDEAQKKALKYASDNGDSGNFRVKQCYGCGLYTAYITLD